jgi:hypothetical protein
VLAVDALCSVNDTTHEALLTLYRQRFSIRIDVTTTERLGEAWE